jgi:hypothetical protein
MNQQECGFPFIPVNLVVCKFYLVPTDATGQSINQNPEVAGRKGAVPEMYD